MIVFTKHGVQNLCPQLVVDEMLLMGKVNKNDYLIDLGSGDGRFVITAAKKHGAKALGVDLDTYLLKLANEAARKEGVTDRVTFREQNLFETDISAATVVSTYLLPEMNLKLRSKIMKLKPGTRVVAHDYSMGDWYPDEQNPGGAGEESRQSRHQLHFSLGGAGGGCGQMAIADQHRRQGRAV